MAKKSWFTIEARGGAEGAPQHAAIDIYDEIGGWGVSAKDFKNALDDVGEVDGIELNIHSPGGSVLDGWAIYNLLKSSPAHVVANVDGLCASMATVVCMAADEVRMPENAFFMIHNPSGLAIGGAEDMRDYADLLDKMEGGIRAAYVGKTGKSDEEIDELMAAETWFTGSEAAEMGFVDVVTDALEMAAMNDVLSACAEDLKKNGIHVPTLAASIEAAEVAEESAEPVEEVLDEVNEGVIDALDACETTDVVEDSDLDAGGELIEQAPESAEDEPEPHGFVDRVKAALLGRPTISENAAALAGMAELRGEMETLQAKLAERGELVDRLRADVAAKDDELMALRAEQASVLDLVTEAGFAPTEAADLPMPDSGDGDGVQAAETALAEAEAKGDAREVYAAVKALQLARSQSNN